eukprot:11977921-Alexandrium_andersonii.AAC.1
MDGARHCPVRNNNLCDGKDTLSHVLSERTASRTHFFNYSFGNIRFVFEPFAFGRLVCSDSGPASRLGGAGGAGGTLSLIHI